MDKYKKGDNVHIIDDAYKREFYGIIIDINWTTMYVRSKSGIVHGLGYRYDPALHIEVIQ